MRFILGIGCLLLRLLLRAASRLRLTLPLLYALLVPALFSGWYDSHYALANTIWYTLIALGVISWLLSLRGSSAKSSGNGFRLKFFAIWV